MEMIVVSVKDSAANAFMRPFFVPSTAVAIRSFTDEINRKSEDNPMYAHSEDYELYDLGEFNEDDGSFDTHMPILLVRGKDVKR